MIQRVPGLSLDALFLDRDGTIIEDRHYLSDPKGVTLIPGVGQALGRLCAAGVRLFVVSNQSGVGRGYFTEKDVIRCQARLEELLLPFGARLTASRWCPHAPEESCFCRKPGIGLWESLAHEYDLDPARCVMAGDKPADVLFGLRAGFAASFLVLTGKGEQNSWASLLAGQDSLRLEGRDLTAFLSQLGEKTPPDLCQLWIARDVAAVAMAMRSAFFLRGAAFRGAAFRGSAFRGSAPRPAGGNDFPQTPSL